MINKKLGQIWIETVLYTLIGLVVIGVVLSFVVPRINERQETVLIEQTISSLRSLDEVILVVNDRGPGNVKSYEFLMKKGSLEIDGEDNKINIVLEGLKSEYSEFGEVINDGRVKILTSKGPSENNVTLTLEYDNIDLEFVNRDEKFTFPRAPTPYTFFIRSNSRDKAVANTRVVSIDEESGISGYEISDIPDSGLRSGLDANLLMRLRFDQGDSRDDSGNGNHGEPNGVSFDNRGKSGVGKSATFTSGSEITFSSSPAPSEEITIGGWFKVEPSSGVASIVAKRNAYLFGPSGNGKMQFWLYSPRASASKWPELVSVSSIPDANWHHWAATFAQHPSDVNKGIMNVYFDGNQDNSITIDLDALNDVGTMQIGKDGAQLDGSGQFIGEMDDVQIYNKALSLDEIKEVWPGT